MSVELPDIFKPRNLIAVGLAAMTEWGLSAATGVNPEFSMNSFVAFALAYLLVAWIGAKAYGYVKRRRAAGDGEPSPPTTNGSSAKFAQRLAPGDE